MQAFGPLNVRRNIPYNNPCLLIFHKIIFICERLQRSSLGFRDEMLDYVQNRLDFTLPKQHLHFFLWKQV